MHACIYIYIYIYIIIIIYIYSFPPPPPPPCLYMYNYAYMYMHAGFLGYTHRRRSNPDSSPDLTQCQDLELLRSFLKYMEVYLFV